MNLSLATKYRPQIWKDIVGQESVVKILSRQLEINQLRNCYLFYGASGTGKTTLARIFAKEINKGVGNPIEIDAASNSGVDNVREIISQAQERSLEGTYKIYIIDECHVLSNTAWNALLKLIEEPPKYTIFIFCTTDIQKVPNTIINRVQVYNFTRLPLKSVERRLRSICIDEGIKHFEDAALEYISKFSNGGMRDAITLLDKCLSYSEDITVSNVIYSLGYYSYDEFFNLINNIIDGNEAEVLKLLDYFFQEGKDLKAFVDQFLSFCIDITKYSIFKNCDLLKLPSSMEDKIKSTINFDNPTNYFTYVIDKLLELKNMIKSDTDIRSTVDVVLLQITRCM